MLISEIIFIFYILAFLSGLISFKKISLGLYFAGAGLNISFVVFNWIRFSAPPLYSMYNILILLGAFSFVGFIMMKLKIINCSQNIFSITGAIPIGISFMFYESAITPLPPALRSVWFIPHVASYMLGYCFAVMIFLKLLQVILICKFKLHEIYQSPFFLSENSKGYINMVLITLSFMAFGMFSGALWAEEVWGRYWSWDPKETWALVTIIFYFIYYQLLKTEEIRGFAEIIHLFAFLSLLMTFFVVNILPKFEGSMHSYL
ncbi:MAG: hypothetical protein ACD_79C00611G0001 [uncultured bacterium]|nr:MAG: hypothetical protein ACD_79C00611G0001 [uncultured bacterium]